MSSPCTYCGVNPSVSCKHRPADPNWHLPVQLPDEPKALTLFPKATHGHIGKGKRGNKRGRAPRHNVRTGKAA